MRTKSIFSVIVLLSLIMVILLYSPIHAKEVRGVTDDTIKIGAIADMTGPIANVELTWIESIRNYYLYINDNGGINGRKVKVIVDDTRYSIPIALAIFKKQVYRDKVLSIIGTGMSGGDIALIPQIQKEKMPVIAMALTKILADPLKRYIFPLTPSYEDGAKILFDYIMKNKGGKEPRIAFVYPDNDYGKDNLAGGLRSAEFYDTKLVDKEVLSFSAIDAATQVMGLRKASADHVIFVGDVGTSTSLLKAARMYKYSPKFFGIQSACNEDIIKMAKVGAKKYYGVHCFSSWYEDEPGMAEVRKITLTYKPGTEKPFRTKEYSRAWVFAVILAEGMKRAGKDLNNETLVDALETIKNFSMGGISGPINLSSTNHRGGKYSRVYKSDVEKGIFYAVTDWEKADFEK